MSPIPKFQNSHFTERPQACRAHLSIIKMENEQVEWKKEMRKQPSRPEGPGGCPLFGVIGSFIGMGMVGFCFGIGLISSLDRSL